MVHLLIQLSGDDVFILEVMWRLESVKFLWDTSKTCLRYISKICDVLLTAKDLEVSSSNDMDLPSKQHVFSS